MTDSVVEGGRPMKTRKPDAQRVVERNLLPEPESRQKYSNEVRERITKKAYELYEQRGRQAERDVDDWLKAEELARKEMNDTRE
jgi:exoribonuclease II